jgi:uncharacterized protein involved in cysteine biosynthesis
MSGVVLPRVERCSFRRPAANSMDSIGVMLLAANPWFYWLAWVLFILAVLGIAATFVGYYLKVLSNKVPRK